MAHKKTIIAYRRLRPWCLLEYEATISQSQAMRVDHLAASRPSKSTTLQFLFVTVELATNRHGTLKYPLHAHQRSSSSRSSRLLRRIIWVLVSKCIGILGLEVLLRGERCFDARVYMAPERQFSGFSMVFIMANKLSFVQFQILCTNLTPVVCHDCRPSHRIRLQLLLIYPWKL